MNPRSRREEEKCTLESECQVSGPVEQRHICHTWVEQLAVVPVHVQTTKSMFQNKQHCVFSYTCTNVCIWTFNVADVVASV